MAMAKYFEDKPDDVTCETCPYVAIVVFRGHKVPCCFRHAPTTEEPNLIADAKWCGEHPWFVEQREHRGGYDRELGREARVSVSSK